MNEPVLVAKGLCFAYGRNEVLKDISLSVGQGEYLSLVGVNGSGKTTLLALLAGFLRPARGELFLQGRKLSGVSYRDRARAMAVVSQNQDMSFPFTCLEIVLMGLHPGMGRLVKISDAQLDRAKEIMESMDVWRFAATAVTEVSGGERQRVILARALLQEPRVLLLDEAMSELDVAAKCAVMKLLLKRVEETGMSVISVHHDLSAAFRFSTRVCALKDGKIIADGKPCNVMDEEFFRLVFAVDAEIIADRGFIINDNIEQIIEEK